MKIVIQWKDPDRCVCSCDSPLGAEAVRTGDSYKLPEDIQEALDRMGEGEYLQVEFDTETGVTRVLGGHGL